MRKRAVLYAYVVDIRQNAALGAQIRACSAYCDERGIYIVLKENDSGTKFDGLSACLTAIDDKRADLLIIRSLIDVAAIQIFGELLNRLGDRLRVVDQSDEDEDPELWSQIMLHLGECRERHRRHDEEE